MLAVLTLYLFLSFFSNISLFLIFFLSYSLFLFPGFQVFNTIVLLVVVVPIHGKGRFYSTCRDHILLF